MIGEEAVPCTICGDSAILWDPVYEEGWCPTHADEYDVRVEDVVNLYPPGDPQHTHSTTEET